MNFILADFDIDIIIMIFIGVIHCWQCHIRQQYE